MLKRKKTIIKDHKYRVTVKADKKQKKYSFRTKKRVKKFIKKIKPLKKKYKLKSLKIITRKI